MATARTDATTTSIGLLLLRLVTGGLLLFGHGLPKLLAWRERAATFADPIGLGPVTGFWLVVFTEVACSMLVAVGWLTRFACVFLVGFLTIAGFVQHAADPFKVKELAFVYLAPFLCLLWSGPGRFSLDRWNERRLLGG